MDKQHHFDPLMKIQALDFIIKQQLSDRAYRVYSFLVFRYNTYTMRCNPSIEYMAQEMNKSPSYIKRALRELRKKNFISNKRGSLTTGSNLYRLVGTTIGIYESQRSYSSSPKVNSVTNEGSHMSHKYINEYIKENINPDSHTEPELSEGSGSGAITEEEWRRVGMNISKIIKGEDIN